MDHSSDQFPATKKARDLLKLIRLNRLGLLKQYKSPTGQPAPKVSNPHLTNSHLAQASAEQLESTIRLRIDGGEQWSGLSNLAKELMHKFPTEQRAVWLFEMAFVNGTKERALELFSEYSTQFPLFYFKLHKSIRSVVSQKLWNGKQKQKFQETLLKRESFENLSPEECMLIIVSRVEKNQGDSAFQLFNQYDSSLIATMKKSGHLYNLNLGYFYLTLARKAIVHKNYVDAKEFLEHIPFTDPNYTMALRILESIQPNLRGSRGGELLRSLLKESDPYKKIIILKKQLDFIRSHAQITLGAMSDLDKALSQLSEIFEPDVMVWKDLSKTLWSYRDLVTQLPSVLGIFTDNLTNFEAAELQIAIWSTLTHSSSFEEGIEKYYVCIASIHNFVASTTNLEARLWDMRRRFFFDQRHQVPKGLPSWNDVIFAALNHVNRSRILTEPERKFKRSVLQVAVSGTILKPSEIENYLSVSERPNALAMDAFRSWARHKGNADLEAKILQKVALNRHYTNKDLGSFWNLACRKNDHDLAWRCASILISRDAAIERLVLAWKISGEKRSEYALTQPNPIALEACLFGFDQSERRLAEALLQVGPRVPELLGIMKNQATAFKPIAYPKYTSRYRLDQFLNKLGWLAQPKTQELLISSVVHPEVQCFTRVMPSNDWSQLLALVIERLGVQTWGWNLADLASEIDHCISRYSSRLAHKKGDSKVEKWIRKLSPEQRSAFYSLRNLARELDPERVRTILTQLICRLTTVMYQDHYQALKSLQVMRVPLAVIWKFETWLLSNEYTNARRSLATNIALPVTTSLRSLKSIVIE